MKKLLYLLTISAAMLGQGCSSSSTSATDSSDSTANSADSTLSTDTLSTDAAPADTTFASKAAVSGMAEVEFGQLALEKASNAKVKDFASMMVTDHGKANQELKAIASAKNITLPASLDAEHAKVKEELEAKKGAEFDKAYVKAMVEGHQKTLALMESGSTGNQDPDLKAFAGKTAPVVKHHLDLILKIQSELK